MRPFDRYFSKRLVQGYHHISNNCTFCLTGSGGHATRTFIDFILGCSFFLIAFLCSRSCSRKPTNLQADTINRNIPHTFEPFQDHFLPLVSPFLPFSCPLFSAVLPACIRSSQNCPALTKFTVGIPQNNPQLMV